MSYKEADIVAESDSGAFWILKDKKQQAYVVMKAGITHSQSIASFPLDVDGYLLAEAYFNYQVKRN